MPTIAAKFGLSESDRRALRLNMETYFDTQHVRLEIENRIRQYADHEGLVACVGEEAAEELKLKGQEVIKAEIRKYKPNEKKKLEGDPRFIEASEKAWAFLENKDNHRLLNDLAHEQEEILKKTAMSKIQNHRMWTEWLENVKGIGPCLAGGMLALTSPDRAPSVSAFWKYAGLSVTVQALVCAPCALTLKPEGAPTVCPQCKGPLFRVGEADRRRKGEKLGYNPRVKTLAWKISSQFVRTPKSQYRGLYDRLREEVNKRPCHKVHLDEKTKKEIPCFDAHKHAKALRQTAKIFFSHYWVTFRAMAGLPVPKPFAFGVLGHDESHLIDPMVDEGDPLPLELRRPWEVKK